MQRYFLIAVGAVYFGFSLPALIDPERVLAFMSLSIDGLIGLSEARGNYGGMLTGVGTLTLIAAYRPTWRPGVYLMLAFLNGGYVIGRLVSIAIDGSPGTTVLGVMLIEALVCFGSVHFFRSTGGFETAPIKEHAHAHDLDPDSARAHPGLCRPGPGSTDGG